MPFPLLAVFLGTLALSGCDAQYPESMTYPLRSDPLVLVDLNGSGLSDQAEPDRPGQLPLLATKGLFDPRNPMYPKRDDLFKAGYLRDPDLLSSKDRDELEKTLTDLFGTPADPKVSGDQIDDPALATVQLTKKRLRDGSRLYRIHCLHCHGLTGDGRGPTAQWINPHPRDFRQGLFKFQSINQLGESKRRPHRDDLRRTLEQGIEATSMPSFTLLSDRERDNIVSYVMHLSIRGQVEFMVLTDAFQFDAKNNALKRDPDGPLKDVSLPLYIKGTVDFVVNKWVDSQKPEERIEVPAFPYKEVDFDLLERGDQEQQKNFEVMKKSVHNGHSIFLEPKKAQCATAACHADYGRQARFRYDEWGTLVRAADLTRGVYRGGRRPLDLMYRVHSGINGSGMANFGSVLKDRNDLWDVVNFLQVLPYPGMRQKYELPIQ